MLQTGLWKYLAPTSMGAGYAIAKGLLLRGLIPEEGYVTDFTSTGQEIVYFFVQKNCYA